MRDKALELGIEMGEICNREGCKGIITEHKSNGSCSCHINPPCSHCVDDRHYCPVCDWQGIDEQKDYPKTTDKETAYYKLQNETWAKDINEFYEKYRTGMGIEKLEIRIEGHTHFSQKVTGIFPEGTETIGTILPKVTGTFGGRFNYFGKYAFTYIAYTD